MRFASLCLLASILLALLFGAQTLSWSWGPSLICLGGGVAATLAIRPAIRFSWILVIWLAAAALWIGWRAWQSPVVEDARADAILVLAVISMAWVSSRLEPTRAGLKWLTTGLSFLILANGLLALAQWFQPALSWPYPERPGDAPSGFFGHYNYFSNFMIGAGLFVAPRTVLANDRTWQRILHGLAFLCTVTMVPISGSRGGLLGLGVGLLLLCVGVALVSWRRKNRSLLITACISPVVCLLILLASWQSLRGTDSGQITSGDVARNLDNSARLTWYKVAMRVVGDHPWMGGGSRAYSWERNRHWDGAAMGTAREDEPFVHNEALQLGTDYGGIGVILVGGALLTAGCLLVAALAVGRESVGGTEFDPLAAGVLPAMAGMLVQANFSFVFHLLPSTLLLGLWLGMSGRILGKPSASSPGVMAAWASRLFGTAAAVALMAAGTAASVALGLLWPLVGRQVSLLKTQPAAGWERLTEAAKWWPGWSLEKLQANTSRVFADRTDLSDEDRWEWYETAASSYARALSLHPFNTTLRLNHANTLSILGRDSEAEAEFERAIQLQGGMESVFHVRLHYAQHLHDTALEEWGQRQPESALARLLVARALLDESLPYVPGWVRPKEQKPLALGIAEVRAFLENANIQPSGWERPRVEPVSLD